MHGVIESGYRVEWRPLSELGAVAPEWQSLADRALEPNVFLEPAFARAAAPVLGRDVGVGLIWSRTFPNRLVGFFPARVERRRYGIPLPILVGWTHPFAPLGTPLIDRDQGAAAVSAWLAHLAGGRDLPRLLLMPFLPSAGDVAQAFDAALAQHGGDCLTLAAHQRAMLAPAPASRADYLTQAIGAKKRKELRRQRKRLAEASRLRTETVRDPGAVATALGDFFALESSGWKGRSGTAARADAAIHTFMQQAVMALAQAGKARITRLSIGEQAIAALVTLQSGATAWCWKIAYDEAFARFSPGVQLLIDATQDLLDDAAVARADSCATAGHPMIDHVWRERLALSDRLVRIGPQPAFAVACALERTRRAAIGGLKRVRDAVRG
jgi:CelD/BcsL family acetyltransferase involved in cellulose biosynthesis